MQIIHKPIEPSDIAFSDKINSSKKFIDDALEYAHGTHDFYDIVKTVIAGDAQFFYADDAALITEIIDYPKRRTLRFWLAGGNLQTLKKIELDAIEWSKDWDCVACEIVGRRGWIKALDGFVEAGTVGVKNYG